MSTAFPESAAHADAARAAVEFFSAQPAVEALLLVGSWARGHGERASDLDLAVLVAPDLPADDRRALLDAWQASAPRRRAGALLRPLVPYSDVDVDVVDGEFAPRPRGWTSGPDAFELEVGNYVAHSIPLHERGDRYRDLRERWLPYYGDELRAARLEAALRYCRNDLDHVPFSLARGDRFHAFHRLYHAAQEFLQALFVARRVYPFSYDKWVAVQLDELLGLPGVASELAGAVGVAQLDALAIAAGAEAVDRLLGEHVATI